MATAYSYLRFSSPQQSTGDSIRRQMDATADWCVRHNARLDTTLRDDGVSAFKGKHRQNTDVHGLAQFLAAVKAGRVPVGSFLVVENLDRLTRENVVPAVNLFTSILLSGIRIVQLKPHEQTFDDRSDMSAIMLALLELSRGNNESRMKSERIGAAWANKRKNAATKLVTSKLPGWMKLVNGKPVLDPARATIMRRLFSMARADYGLNRIAQALNAEKVPTLGRKTYKGRRILWSASIVHTLLISTATFGEYQPQVGRNTDRKPSGPAIPDYYPAVVTRDEYDAVRGALAARSRYARGRRSKRVNLFSGLLRDARTGGNFCTRAVRGRVSLVPADAHTGRGRPWVSFLLPPLEEGIVSRLAEVQPEDIAPADGTTTRVEVLTGKLAEVEALKAKWAAKMDNPDLVETVAAKLAELGARSRELSGELAEARREAASPIGTAWSQARIVGKRLDDDDTRLRYRAAVLRAVESIYVLPIPGHGARVAAAQVFFKGGAVRSYLVGYQARVGAGKGKATDRRVWSRSFKEGGLKGKLDLRDPKQAATLEKVLKGLELTG